jgi:hypothetical protein
LHFPAFPAKQDSRFGGNIVTSIAHAPEQTLTEVTNAIREVCERAKQPEEIWDALDARGIETTPGIVHQTINDLTDPQSITAENALDRKPLRHSSTGLTTEDINLLAAVAEKLGGVEALIVALKSMKHVAK